MLLLAMAAWPLLWWWCRVAGGVLIEEKGRGGGGGSGGLGGATRTWWWARPAAGAVEWAKGGERRGMEAGRGRTCQMMTVLSCAAGVVAVLWVSSGSCWKQKRAASDPEDQAWSKGLLHASTPGQQGAAHLGCARQHGA